MRSTSRTLFMVVLLPFLAGVACDPQAPGAIGQLTVAPEAKLAAGRTLEIRFVPDAGEPFDVATADLIAEYPHRQASWTLAEIEFPFYYEIGGGLGSSAHENWRVIAWVAGSEEVDRPNPGEWYGTRVFAVEDCGMVTAKFCGVTVDIDFEIDTRRELPMSDDTGSAGLAPGKQIERQFNGYTMRCMEGDDPARSVGTFVVRLYSGDASPDKITETIGNRDGVIENCWMANIDDDENAEVLVFTKSAGSGGYANLYVYDFDGLELASTALPEPDLDMMSGYEGRDRYEFDDAS